ncbi:TetR/AcrR family transcriptional regulator [Spirillospora sp. NPDC047279]|uniref:TetR/AcrR family transcriptional regulator n=1 Tax=Spirillospora sp. NPDC047279 TaxID=3155478 RepID=UPI0033ED3058
MTEYSGTGDPRRTLELLWGVQGPPRRGPKPRLTVEEIVRCAIRIADDEGLGALAMRRIGEELGVSSMSIYTYVPGKAELIDVMLDRVYGELEPGADVPGGWRARLTHIARQNWELCHRHPWMLRVSTGRPPLGPNSCAKYEDELAAVEGLGLTDLEMDAVVTLVVGHAHNAARFSVEGVRAARRTGMSDQDWWDASSPLLAELFGPERYPIGSRVGAAAGKEHGGAIGPAHAFEFGLERVLDGVQVLVDARR